MDFKNRVALVTGVAKGIGEAIAKILAKNGASLYIVDINEKGLFRVKDDCEALGATVYAEICDISDENRVKACTADCLDKFGKIDILINNAGVYFGEGEFLNSKREDWKKLIDINIYGTLYFTQEVLPNMVENKYGRIVNLASVAGVYGISYFPIYSLTKGGIHSFTKALSKSVAKYGITVNCVSPGNIHEGDPNEQPENFKTMSFLDRCGTPEECANVICFLASDDASFVTGQDYLCDGGRRMM